MLIVSLPLVLIFAGGLMYGLAANAKLAEIGRIMFAVGLLGLVFAFPGLVGATHIRIG